MNEEQTSRPARPRRSVLYVPAGNARALAKSRTLHADAIVYDLEDSLAPDAKAGAREALRGFFREGRPDKAEVVIRINALDTAWGGEDLLAARACGPDAILLPKVGAPADIRAASEALDETDAPSSLRLWAMIETPQGALDAAAISATAREPASRLDCFVVGTNDLVKDTRLPGGGDNPYLAHWLMPIVLAARSGGIDVIDGVHNDFADAAGFEQACARGRSMGFDGKSLIHPGQIGPANAAFSIAQEALDEARAIVAAFSGDENRHRGVISLGGRMVERLHLEAAERLLAKAALLNYRQDRT